MSVSDSSLNNPRERDSMKSLFLEQSAKVLSVGQAPSDHNSNLNSIFSAKEIKTSAE
jgi:hypothetical protein